MILHRLLRSTVNFIELEIILLLTLSNIFVGLGIFFFFARNRLKTLFFNWASEFKDGLLDEIREKPELIEQIMLPVIAKFAKKYGVPEPGVGGGQMLKVFGWKIPMELVTMFAGNVLKKGAEKAIEASPFG